MTSDNNEERVETTEQSIPVSGVEVPETNDDAVAEEKPATATPQPNVKMKSGSSARFTVFASAMALKGVRVSP